MKYLVTFYSDFDYRNGRSYTVGSMDVMNKKEMFALVRFRINSDKDIFFKIEEIGECLLDVS